MRKCKDCEHFHIICQPMEHYEAGQAECKKHNLITDFFSTQKINRLTCIEEGSEKNE
jgi:hypothetical protein